MSDPAESEQNPKPEQPKITEIELDQEFYPFEHGIKKLPIILKVTDTLTIPLDIYHDPNKSPKYEAFTPVHPTNGYQFTPKDSDYEERKKKVEALMAQNDEYIDRSLDSDTIWIYKRQTDIAHESNLANRIGEGEYQIKPEFKPIIERLRARVTIPGTPELSPENPDFRQSVTFEARPKELSGLDIARIWFSQFYPTDYGPLAHDDRDPRTTNEKTFGLNQEGLNVQFPNDPEITSQIAVKFYIQKEEEEEPKIPESPDYTPTQPINGGLIRPNKS